MVKRVGSIAQRLKEKPYEKRVCRSENYPDCLMPPFPDTGVTVEEYADFIAEIGLEVQIVAAEMDRGTPRFASKMLPPFQDIERDPLPRFLELAHERGILALTYISMNYCKPLKKIHPEWMMKFLDDGREEIENIGWPCFNSPFRDWRAEHLKEYLDNLDLDGFYFDDMNWGSHDDGPYYIGCCCKYCEKMFKEETGLKIPTKVDFDSMDFRQFLGWRADKMRQFMAHVTRSVRQMYPDAILDFNYYGGVYGNWSLAHPVNPLHLEEVGGHFFSEATLYDGTSLAAKLCRALGPNGAVWMGPTQWLHECITHTAPYPEPLTPTILSLSIIANGMRPVQAMIPAQLPLAKDYARVIYSNLKKRVEYMEGDTVKYVALHWSQQSRDFHRPSPDQYSGAVEHFKRMRGAYEILNQSHLLTDISFDEHLTRDYLSRYKLLFLSDTSCLSSTQCDAIRSFVEGGGTLLATHEASLRDELGRPRDTFQLADVLGVDYCCPTESGGGVPIIYVPHDQALSREFGHVICLGAEDAEVSLRPGCQTEVLATKSNLTGVKPLDRFDPKVKYDSGRPGVTCRAFGKGKAFYISGDVGWGYTHNPYPPLKRFVANLIRRTRSPIEVDAPKVVEVTAAMRGPNELMVHLLNNPTPYVPHSYSAESHMDVMTYFYNLEEVTPVRDVTIRFNEFLPRTAVMPLQNLRLDIAGSPPTVVVPQVFLQHFH